MLLTSNVIEYVQALKFSTDDAEPSVASFCYKSTFGQVRPLGQTTVSFLSSTMYVMLITFNIMIVVASLRSLGLHAQIAKGQCSMTAKCSKQSASSIVRCHLLSDFEHVLN